MIDDAERLFDSVLGSAIMCGCKKAEVNTENTTESNMWKQPFKLCLTGIISAFTCIQTVEFYFHRSRKLSKNVENVPEERVEESSAVDSLTFTGPTNHPSICTHSDQTCIRAWPCPPTSPTTLMTPGITSTLRPARRCTCPPPGSRACCPPSPTCRPATRPTSPTASAGTTAGPRPARMAPHSLRAALTLHTASPTLTARQSAPTPAGTRPTRARCCSGTARGRISTEARWCARSEAPTPAPTRT